MLPYMACMDPMGYMKGSTIPERIINQQGLNAATAHLEGFHQFSWHMHLSHFAVAGFATEPWVVQDRGIIRRVFGGGPKTGIAPDHPFQ